MSTETPEQTESASDASAAPEQPWYSGTYDPATPGKLADDWLSKAPEDLRKDLEPYGKEKDPWEIALKAQGRVKEAQTALRNKQAAAAGVPVKPEGDKATPEALAEYYKARGIPADPKEYGITRPDDIPEHLWRQEEMDGYAALFHKHELKPEIVKELTAFGQAQARQAMAVHAAAMAEARAQQIQSDRETLHRVFGINVDPVLKKVSTLAQISGMSPDSFDPAKPESFVGVDVIKALDSIIKMIPKHGDPTAKGLGRGETGGSKDRAYFQNLKKDHPDYVAMSNPGDPRHAAVMAERDAAYQVDVALRQKSA